MAPQESPTDQGFEVDATISNRKDQITDQIHASREKTEFSFSMITYFILVHLCGAYGAFLFLFKAKLATGVFAYILYAISMVGITAGAHRLWGHRAYKAKLPLRLILALFATIACQSPIRIWARDHRTHHKYVDTNGDPHNITRGLFYANIGWLLTKKTEEVKAKGRTIDISDLMADDVVRFQQNTFLINSAAHTFGMKPYDKSIKPGEVMAVSLATLGDGFHNYHHTFPWDYRGSELGFYYLNLSGYFIYLMSKIGWAYDLKTASKELITMRAKRTGDGSHSSIQNVWGWDDKDISKIEKDNAIIVNPDGTKPYM